MLKKGIIALLCLVAATWSQSYAQNTATLKGRVTDTLNKVMVSVNIGVSGTTIGTITDNEGKFELKVPANRNIVVDFLFIGYTRQTVKIKLAGGEIKNINIRLVQDEKMLKEVNIRERPDDDMNVTRLDAKLTSVLPTAGGPSIESMLKTMPGVRSRNELSSQYSVRGGNFDENLVYVNDIEVYRPFLIRSGQQEGLSFINPDMVKDVKFSAGGFEARYGDKMSSVLDITYKRPKEFEATVAGSFMGGSATVGGTGLDGRFSHITGGRYKTSKYILNTLDIKGEYVPTFLDFQTYLNFATLNWNYSLLANFSQNSFSRAPTSRRTVFGTVQLPHQLSVFFQGEELDKFSSGTFSMVQEYRPNEDLSLKFISSYYQTAERETFDIYGQYYINELDKNLGSDNFGDSTLNLGLGAALEHARNYLEARVISFSHKGKIKFDKAHLQWGVKYQKEIINDNLSEWVYLDSAGYSSPNNQNELLLYEANKADISLNSDRITSYLQSNFIHKSDRANINLIAGLRAGYWTYNQQFILSPRVSVYIEPKWLNKEDDPLDIIFRIATGLYQQPPFYKELRDRDGNIYPDAKAQKSWHFLLGNDYYFKAWGGRRFKLVTEAYYKKLTNLTPFEIDNVKIVYMPDLEATGFVKGIDVKLNGEFVENVDSWLSFSLLSTKEDIIGDDHGKLPRPTDQLFSVGLFFQDYLPGNDTFKAHLNLIYGSKIKVGPPGRPRHEAVFSLPSYKRVDLGFSKDIYGIRTKGASTEELLKINEKKKSEDNRFFKHIMIAAELFNVLDAQNVISFYWVTVVQNEKDLFSQAFNKYAVPNYLTGRRLNVRIIAKF